MMYIVEKQVRQKGQYRGNGNQEKEGHHRPEEIEETGYSQQSPSPLQKMGKKHIVKS